MSNDRYTVFIKDSEVHSNLTEEEYLDLMENLSIEFYQTGSPKPHEIKTTISRST
jgi:hypothetical protein